MKHFISLGAGVQSSTMALMAAHGEITPMPDAAIFADTQDEPREVYAHLEWLKSVLPFPVHIATAGKLSKRLLEGFEGARTPFYVKGGGLQNRQCTREFKIRPIRRKIREAMGCSPRQHIWVKVYQWIGISIDEADRMKPSGVGYMENRFPLIEKMMNRDDCRAWLWNRYRRTAPKSACKQCPYQETARLQKLKESSPDEWSELVQFDQALRTPKNVARFRGEVYVHRSCQPLVQIDFSAWASDPRQGQLFSNECEGMCGV